MYIIWKIPTASLNEFRSVVFLLIFCSVGSALFGQAIVTGFISKGDDGSSLSQVQVRVLVQGAEHPLQTIFSNAEGRFEISLPEGKAYRLLLQKPLYFSTHYDFDLKVGQDRLDLKLALSAESDTSNRQDLGLVQAEPLRRTVSQLSAAPEMESDQIETKLKRAYLQSTKGSSSLVRLPQDYSGYLIELTQSKVKLGAGHPKMSRFNKVFWERDTNQLYRYYLGGFSAEADAHLFLKELQQEYPKATITEYHQGSRR